MSILVINAGSTSLKFGLFDGEARETLVSGTIDWADGNRQRAQFLLRRGSHEKRSVVAVPDDRAAATCAVQALAAEGDITVVGHRVVNGGSEIRDSVLIDDKLKETIARLATLAPLHNPPALAAIGDEFVDRARAAVLIVPSVLAPSESNWLINPRHAAFEKIRVNPTEPFQYDSRFFR